MGDVELSRGRKAVGDGGEVEVIGGEEGGGALGGEKTVVVVLGVDEGDVEAMGVDELGKVEHGGYMALCWEWDTYCMGFLCLCFHLCVGLVMGYRIHMVLFMKVLGEPLVELDSFVFSSPQTCFPCLYESIILLKGP